MTVSAAACGSWYEKGPHFQTEASQALSQAFASCTNSHTPDSAQPPGTCTDYAHEAHPDHKTKVQYLAALGTSARPGGPTFLGHVGLGWHQGTGEPTWVPGLCWRSAGLTPCVRASHWEQASLSTARPKLASASPEVHFQSLGLRWWRCGWCPSGMPGFYLGTG